MIQVLAMDIDVVLIDDKVMLNDACARAGGTGAPAPGEQAGRDRGKERPGSWRPPSARNLRGVGRRIASCV